MTDEFPVTGVSGVRHHADFGSYFVIRTSSLVIWTRLSVLLGVFLCHAGLAGDTNSILNNWFAAQEKIQAWSADFVQTRTFKTLTRPLTAQGHIDFMAPVDFRWALGRPAQTIALRHQDDMYVIYPLLKRAEVYPMGPNAPRQLHDMMSMLQAGLPHSRKEFDAQFQVLTLVETNRTWHLTLQPKSAGARQMLPGMTIGLSAGDYSLVSTELVFADGSTMRNDFTNAVVNPSLDKSLFEWKPPENFDVTHPAGR